MKSMRLRFRPAALAALLSATTLALSGAAHAENDEEKGRESPGALWWQQALSFPFDTNPVLDEDGSRCSLGQNGHLWFLYGSFGGPQIVRDCIVPAGRRLFFPIVNFACLPFPEETIEENVAACAAINDASENMHLTIDGVSRDGLIRRQVQRRPFAVTLPADNIFGVEPGVYVAVHDGFYATVKNLAPGDHTVRIQGANPLFGFELDVLYQLQVLEAVKVSPP